MPKKSGANERLRQFIAPALSELGLKVAATQLDEITELVATSMAGAGRFFHNPDHVIHVGSQGDAISVVAAFFHDLVYFQVDQGVGLNVARHISPFITEQETGLFLRPVESFEKQAFARVVLDIFGYVPSDLLPASGGQNEFLSALTAASVLAPYTSLAQIAQIAACIEATIPFRGKNKGATAAEHLLKRLQKANQVFSLGMTAEQVRAAVRRAVKMANQDVSNFGGESATRFLKNTWELVPEINPKLRSPAGYSVEGYRLALQKMDKFFANLDPQSVFQSFDGEPSAATLESVQKNATRHVEEARYYFRLKLLSLALLEAISGTLGKNLGLPILMGELSNLGSPEDRVEKFLPRIQVPKRPSDPLEARLLSLLENSEEEQQEVGLKSSPLTAFLVRMVGFRELVKIWPVAERFFADSTLGNELIAAFPTEVIGYVSDAISVLLQKRAHRISTFVGSSSKN